MSTTQTTTLNRQWVLKMVAFLVVLAGFGTWGLVDGLWVYPNRGEKDASYKLWKYLETARDSGRLTQADASVTDPQATFSELEGRERELKAIAQGQTTARGTTPRAAAFELARLEWLRSLKRVWRLDSAPSRLQDDLTAQLNDLTTTWKATNPPKPLDAFDLHFQWLFVILGYTGSLWLLVTMARAKAKTFTWDPATHRLTLPDGASFTPAEITEFDKRKWHKFFITLTLADGRTHTLDLLRHVPLEAWILEMERIAHPELAQENAEKSAPDTEPEPESGADAAPQPVGGDDARDASTGDA